MLHTPRQRQVSFLLFLALLGFTLTSPVSSASLVPSRHCVIEKTQELVCFDTFTEALRFASQGNFAVQAATDPSSLTKDELDVAGILALLYDARDQTGTSLAIVGDACGVAGDMPASWNNRVSSGRTGSCGVYLYDGTRQMGNRVFIAAPGTPYIGDLLNDRASSWRIP